MTSALKQLIPPDHVARFVEKNGKVEVEFVPLRKLADLKQGPGKC